MLDGLPIGLIDGVGTVGVCVLFTWLILSGRLVPRRTYDDAVHEKNEWKAESRIKDAQMAKRDEQLGEKDRQLAHLGEVGRTVEALASAIQKAAHKVEESP